MQTLKNWEMFNCYIIYIPHNYVYKEYSYQCNSACLDIHLVPLFIFTFTCITNTVWINNIQRLGTPSFLLCGPVLMKTTL